MTRFMVWWLKRLNPEFRYEFYDDERIEQFVAKEYPGQVAEAYFKLDIGAAKADFFRYLVLYRFGGVYMDMDAYCTKPIDSMVNDSDTAIITAERNEGIYAQYALLFAPQHLILKDCIETICFHISERMHLHDIHKLTGPSVFTDAVNRYQKENPDDKTTRILGVDYNGVIKPKYWLHAGLFSKREKWQTAQQSRPAVKE